MTHHSMCHVIAAQHASSQLPPKLPQLGIPSTQLSHLLQLSVFVLLVRLERLATMPGLRQETEPLLAENPDRFCMFPIKHADVWEMYKKAEASFWTGKPRHNQHAG